MALLCLHICWSVSRVVCRVLRSVCELEPHGYPAAGDSVAAVVVRAVVGEHRHRRERVLLDELQGHADLEL